MIKFAVILFETIVGGFILTTGPPTSRIDPPELLPRWRSVTLCSASRWVRALPSLQRCTVVPKKGVSSERCTALPPRRARVSLTPFPKLCTTLSPPLPETSTWVVLDHPPRCLREAWSEFMHESLTPAIRALRLRGAALFGNSSFSF